MAKINRSLAIVIGIDKYEQIPELKNAVFDAEKLASVLKNIYGYEVLLLLNQRATKAELDRLVTNLKNKTIQFDRQLLQVEQSDRLLFYFAGHGLAKEAQDNEDGKPAGYFMPQDAEDDNRNTWLSMQEVYKVFTELDCHHLLMILDCCFAGRISWAGNGRNAARSRKLYQQSYDHFIKYPTQQIITSAAHDEKAQDSFGFGQRGEKNGHSPFAHFLLKVLKSNSDGGKDKSIEGIVDDKVITVQELFSYLQNQLGKVAQGQTAALFQPRQFDKKTGKYVFFKGEYVFPLPNFNSEKLEIIKLDENTNPYKGLNSFEEEDSQLFFGRTRLIKDRKEGLFSKVSDHLLTVVLGTSGSGKSSLVKAGLIPALRLAEESGQQKWFILDPMRPGESPINALKKILTESGSASSTILSSSSQEKIKSICKKIENLISPNQKLLLVIDQSEELFTLCQNQEERADFINLLNQLLTTCKQQLGDKKQLRIVLTLRSEFEPQIRDAIKEAHWQQVWQDGRFVVTPMDREELQQAIEEPAAQKALFFESPKLVNDLIDEVVQMPGALPLLSFTLSELYLKYLKAEENHERNDRTITEADYKDIGGVTRSLTQTADKTYNKLVEEEVDEPAKKACELTIRDVMLRMVAINGGELARRKIPTSELVYPGQKNERAKKVIDRFVEARLLVKGLDADVEPVHDALIIGWTKIKYWLDEKQEIIKQVSGWNQINNLLTASLGKVSLPLTSKENSSRSTRSKAEIQLKVNLPLQRDVTTAAVRWNNEEKKSNFLWNASPFLDFLKLVLKSEQNNWLNQLEAEFVQKSVEQKHRNIRLRWQIAIAVILGLSGLLGLSKINEAKTLRESAEINLQKNQSFDGKVDSFKAGDILNNKLVQLLLLIEQLGLKSIEPLGSKSIEQLASKLIEQLGLKSIEPLASKFIEHLRSDSNLQEKVRGTLLRAVNTVRELDRQEADQGMGTVRTSFSPDGKLLASAGENCNVPVRVWDLQSQTLSKSNFIKFKDKPDKSDNFYNKNNCEPVKITRFSSNSQELAVAGAKGTVGVWDLRREDKELIKLKIWATGQGEVKSISFSPDGKLLATAGAKGTVHIWNLDNFYEKPESKILHVFNPRENKQVWSVAFSPDGKRLASTGDNDTIRLWDRKGKEWKENILWNRKGNEWKENINKSSDPEREKVTSVSFSPDGQKMATAKTDGSVRLWDLSGHKLCEKLKPYTSFNTNQNKVWGMEFSPNDNKLATAGEDGTVRLWDLCGKELEKFEGHRGPVRSVSFNSDYQELASAGDDGSVRLWNLRGNESHKFQVNPKDAPENATVEEISPNAKLRATGNKDGTVVWCNLQCTKEPEKTSKGSHVGPVTNLAFSQDSKLLASAGKDRTVRLWNLDNGEQKSLLPTYAIVNSVAFSPDSKLLASAGEDGMVQLWNLQDDLRAGKPFAAWKAYPDSVKKVSFCRDGKVLMTTGKDDTVKWWPIESFDELMQQASVPVRNNLQNNSNVSESDRHLCDDVPVSVTSPISTIPFPTTSPPTVILPSSQAIAEDYYTRGSEQADSEYIKNFPNILAKSSTNVKKAKVYVNRGANYYRQKKYPLAIKDYEEALKIDPNNVDAYINRGIAYSSLQKPEHQRAIEDYEKALNIDSNNVYAYINRGIAYSGLGKHETAIKDYDQAIAIAPQNADAYYAKAFTQTLIEGKKQEAIENYRKAADIYQQQKKPKYFKNALKKIDNLAAQSP